MTTVISAVATGDTYIDGVLYGTQWSGPITYSFADNFADFGVGYSHTVSGFQQISDTQMNAIQSILEGTTISGTPLFTFGSFEQVANLSISLAANPAGASDLTIGQANFFDGEDLPTALVADFPELDQRLSGGDVWFGDDYPQYRTPEVGTYSWATHIHEFGHAVGLSHGHDEGTFIPGFEFAIPRGRDAMEFSVMTYRSYIGDPLRDGYSNEEYGFAQTLMMYDIAALQHLYGADFSTNSGDTVYTWSATTGEMSVNGVGQGAPGGGAGGSANRVFLTIWDGNGEDTYDFSNYTENGLIDLAPGSWSLASVLQRANLGEGAYANGNVYNAVQYQGDLRSLIENAEGGSGNDEISGNQAANSLSGNNGNDVLNGRGGSDELRGGDGQDTLFGDFRAGATYSGTGLYAEPLGNSNDSRATATVLDSFIGYRSDANIQYSQTNPTVSVSGTGDGTVDWYSFDVLAPGQMVVDIDGSLDSFIRLYDSLGNQVAFNDDGTIEPGDANTMQSFIAFTVASPGRYYVQVSLYPGDIVIPNGANYTLNITLPDPVETTPASQGNDQLFGEAGNDVLFGQGGNDRLDGGAGADAMFGGTGDDIYIVAAVGDVATENAREGTDTVRSYINWTLGANIERLELLGSAANGAGNGLNNSIVGNAANNTLRGFGGDDTLNGGAGADAMFGGAGNDIYIVAAAGDVTTENASEGTDTVRSYINWTLANNVERLELQDSSNLNGTGNSLNNTLVGNSGNNSLSGVDGNDYMVGGAGNDTLNGGNGNDRLIGGGGRDTLNGGTGNDVFDFDAVSDSPAGPALRDSIIGGFSHGFDRIDLATIDANTLAAGNQAFSFIGSAAFSGVAGQLRYSNYNGTVIIDADLNGDSTADMQILVAGTSFMTGTDFIV